jgi:DNA-binding PadR family transcriptional regulator
MLRSLTTLPGGPCVVVLCHPIKHVTDPSQLIPRGGGNFLAQMDGNLTLWRHDDNLATLHHLDKWRGPGFEPITFKLEKITTEKLVDSKDRQLPTIHAVAITAAEEEEQEASTEYDENRLLVALAGKKPLSIADLAQRCGWLLANGEPHKSKTDRILRRLQTDGLVKRVRGRKYRLTDKGRQELGDDDDDEITKTVEDRSGAAGSKKPFHALRGMKQRATVPCAFCGKTGDVYRFADGRQPKGQRHYADLHPEHAEPYFTGQSKPKDTGTDRQSDDLDELDLRPSDLH